jgi:hypothetical protein
LHRLGLHIRVRSRICSPNPTCYTHLFLRLPSCRARGIQVSCSRSFVSVAGSQWIWTSRGCERWVKTTSSVGIGLACRDEYTLKVRDRGVLKNYLIPTTLADFSLAHTYRRPTNSRIHPRMSSCLHLPPYILSTVVETSTISTGNSSQCYTQVSAYSLARSLGYCYADGHSYRSQCYFALTDSVRSPRSGP